MEFFALLRGWYAQKIFQPWGLKGSNNAHVVFDVSPPAAECMAVLTAYSPVLASDILGKGGLFGAPPLEDCLTGLTGSSTIAGTGCADLQLISSSMADYQALT